MKILVGHTGFVGSNIASKGEFDLKVNSQNIQDAFGTNPDLLVYAGIPAQKFLANQNREEDMRVINKAIDQIKAINPKKIVLISTIDVYKDSVDMNEDSNAFEDSQAYGMDRRILEEWVQTHIDNHLIVRLPGLYGKGIKKNFIHDMLHRIPKMLNQKKMKELKEIDPTIEAYYTSGSNGFYNLKNMTTEKETELENLLNVIGFNALNFTDSRGTFQFYNLGYLWGHIQKALASNISVLNIATEPVKISEIYKTIYNEEFKNELSGPIPNYNMKTKYASLIGDNKKEEYIMGKEFILDDIKNFVNQELSLSQRLAISNIGWDEELDTKIYELLNRLGIRYLEIAPTRLVKEKPYTKESVAKAKSILEDVQKKYGIKVISIQSIWFGETANLFDSDESYKHLVNKMKEVIEYADELDCKNIVFGCPKNRSVKKKEDYLVARRFFKEIGEYAAKHNVVISIEPNPTIYNTNFLNTTKEAVDFVKALNMESLRINYDLGTVIENKEDIELLKENITYINHIHISEPFLEKIKEREIHKKLIKVLKELEYKKTISIEVKKISDIEKIEEIIEYVQKLIHELEGKENKCQKEKCLAMKK